MKWQQKVARVLRSNKFFAVTLLLFVIQGTFFALAVNPSLQTGETYLDRSLGLVPDGNRHMAAIYHFAAQPIQNGPFIHDMTDAELMMGDLVRFPSYFYYYLLSFPVRAALALNASDLMIVYLVRFIGLGFGILALIVFRRIVHEVRAGPVIANLSTLGLAMTGAFAYFAPAENYDMLSLLMWLCFVVASIKLFVRRDATQLYWMLVIGLFISITKYTYLPFAGVAGIAALMLYVHNSQGWILAWKQTKRQFAQRWKKLSRWRIAALTALLLIGAILFTERIVMNLVNYQSVSPNCAVVHDKDSCMNFTVYKRNVERLDAVAAGETWTKEYHVIEYTGDWLERYYPTMYYYMGHIWVYDIWVMLWVSVGLVFTFVLSMLVYLVMRKRTVLKGQVEWFLLGLVGLFTVGQYAYNVMLFVKYAGQMYGHQGRYLLPVIGFLYVIMLLIVTRAYRLLSHKQKRIALPIMLTVGVFAFVINGALINFIIHADNPDWYSEFGRWLLSIN